MARNASLLVLLLLISPSALAANLTALSVSPSSVVGGMRGATGTVTLDVTAPAGGVLVALASNNTAAAVPANVTVAQGATTATFAVTTTAVTANATATLTGTYNAVNKTAALTVTTLVSTVTVSQSSVVGGMSATGTIALYAPAPVGGAIVTLTSSAPARATVPSSITIPVGVALGTFAIPSLIATTTGSTTITATNSGGSRTAALTTSAAPIPDSVSLAPATAFGTSTSTGTVVLNGAAPIGGTVVTLTSSNTAAATVPANVTVPSGTVSTTFTVTTLTVATNTNVTITAASGGTSKTATQAVAPALQAFSVTVDRGSVTRGQIPTATVTLNGPAPTGGATVTLTSSSTTNATVPASVVMAVGARTATFPVTTLAGGTGASVTISAVYGGATKTFALSLTASPVVLSVGFSASIAAGGQPSTGTVTLSGPAPVGGTVVTLSSSATGVVTVPASVTVPAAASTATFTATTVAVGNDVGTVVTATLGTSASTAILTATAPRPTVVALAPATLVGGNSSTGTITISAAAPTGGVPVFLSSSSVPTATVPASVTVPAGATSVTFTVTTFGVAAATPVTISAVKEQTTRTANLTVNPADVATVALSPTSVVAGTTSIGTVTLNGRARASGIIVALTCSDTTKATVPASVTVAAGASTVTFTVTTLGVATTAPVTISGSFNGTTKTGTLTVQAALLTSVSLSASPVVGGNNVTGTVTLNGKAGASSFAVTLASSDTTCATVPATVTVSTSATTATFTVTTLGVAANKSSTITATLAGVPKTVVISTRPAALSSVALSPTAVAGGAISTGTLTLSGNAPPAGAVVSMSSSDGAATVPATVTVAANTKTKTFTVTTTAVATAHTATISGTYSGTQSAFLTVNPPLLSAVAVNPTTVNGGTAATGMVTLTSAAPAGGTVVSLTSDNAAANVPASVTVAAAATTATFSVSTSFVGVVTTATITATAAAITKTAVLTLNPVALALASVSLSPSSLTGGASSTGTVTLAAPAPAGGFAVNLSSDKTAATVPPTVTVTQGVMTAIFTVTTVAVGTATTATITATAAAVTKTATLTINPPILSSVSLSPTAVFGGTSSSGTVTLTSAAPAGGYTVALMSNNPAAVVPASVTTAAGATTATFTVTTTATATDVTATISGTANGTTKTAVLNVNAPTLSSLSVSPASVTAATGSTGTVTLTSAAPSGGTLVTLSSNNTSAASVPVSVNVTQGQTAATFTVATFPVATSTTVTLTASRSGVNKTATLVVNPCIVGTVPPPSSFPPDVVWVEDTLPAGSVTEGTWTWDTTQKASGTSSQTEPARTGEHWHWFYTDTDLLYVADTDKLVVYVLLNACDPPRELMFMWYDAVAGWEHRAFWGEDLIPSGVLGTPSRTYMGPLPNAGQWVRLEVPAATLGLDGHTLRGMLFDVFDGQVWFDRAGKIATCTPPVAAAPSLPSDTVWVEDTLPVGSSTEGTWTWDTTQKASGTSSHTEPARTGEHWHSFYTDTDLLYAADTDKLVGYVLLNPCDPPRELMFMWYDAVVGWEHRAFWGEDLIPSGVLGTPSRTYMGPLPAAGQWARLEVPAATVALDGHTLRGMIFDVYDGQVWFDRAGKIATCTPPVAAAPSLPADTVWVEDTPPAGSSTEGTWNWDTTQKASGTSSHTEPARTGEHWHSFYTDTQLQPVNAGDKLVVYVLLNPCDPPRELMFMWYDAVAGWEHRAFWGEDLIPSGVLGTPSRTYMGPLPAAGQWARLEVPAATVALDGHTLRGMIFDVYDGHAWFDRAGTSNGVVPSALASVSVSPTPVLGGTSATGTVTLSSPAQAGGFTVTLSSDKTAASVPASVAVAQGATTATFTVTTTAVGAVTTATITATAAGVTKTGTLTINPPALSNVSLSPGSVIGGTPSTGTVTLSSVVPAGGFSVNLSSNNGAAVVPINVTIAQGATTATFTVSTTTVGTTTTATITATAAGVMKTAALTIGPPVLALVSAVLSPTSLAGGASSTGTITLGAPALAGGFAVNLSSDKTAATVPPTVTVLQGATTATFAVSTTAVGTVTTATITASAGAITTTAALIINPLALSNVSLSPTSVTGGTSSTGTATLSSAAPAGGYAVNLSSNNAAATVPTSVTVIAGATTATFTVSTTAVGTVTTATFTATIGAATKMAALTINPPALSNVSLSPTSVTGGTPSTGTATLSSAAPAGGFVVNLTSNNGAATVPASVTVIAGATTATFTASTTTVATIQAATLTATAAGVTLTATLTVNPSPALSAVSMNPTSVVGGSPSTGTVTLTNPAVSGGFSVNLSSDNGAGTVPANVMVAAGATTATFTVTTFSVASATAATITATAAGVTKTAALTINPPALALASVVLSPTSLTGGASSTGTVTLSAPALAGGFAVDLSSDKTNLTGVPATVTVAQGATTATFTITTTAVGTVTTATITATAGVVTKTATFTINPPVLSSVSLIPTSVSCGTPSIGTVTLASVAPAAGFAVNLMSSNGAATTPVNVTVPAGATTATFTVTTFPVGAVATATITASAGAVMNTAALTINPPVLSSVSVTPTTVIGGAPSTGTATITSAAPAGGFSLNLSSNNGAASVPASVTVAPGAATATFMVATTVVGSVTTATITATAFAVTKTVSLTMNPPVFSNVSLSPTSVVGGTPSTGTATISSAAAAGGFSVSLTSNNGATVPASVTIVQGASTATFTVTTPAVGTVTTATITATGGTVTKTATLAIHPPEGTVIGAIRDASTGIAVPLAVVTITGTATTASTDSSGSFSLPAAPGNHTLAVTAPNLQPATTASLTVTTGQTTDVGAISLSAVQGFTFDVYPAIASGTGTATAIVSLVAVAPAGGAIFTLASDKTSFVVPASVTVPAGRRVLTFPVTYTPVASSTWVTISAANAGVTNTAHVTLVASPTVVSLSLATQSPPGPVDSVFGPFDLVGTVVLSEGAPAFGLPVSLTSSSTSAVGVPATILVPAGALLVTFPVHAAAVSTTTTSTITASLPIGSASALLTDTSAPALTSISIGRGSATAGWMTGLSYLRSGTSIQIQIGLNAVAPAGGVVNLTSSNPAVVPVPATVPVNSGASLTLGAGSASSVVIAATYAGVSRSTTLAVSNTIAAQNILYSIGGSLYLFLTGAPTNFAGVSFYSSNSSVVSVPATAAVPAGSEFTSVSASVTPTPYKASVILSGSSFGREVMTSRIDVAPAAAPSGLSLATTSGGTGTGTVGLNGAAPAGGVTVLLGSTSPSVLTVPVSILVPAGALSASFAFSTITVGSGAVVSVTATSAGVTVERSLTLQPPMVSNLSLSPTSVPGGIASTGTVTLNGPAPTGGYSLSLSSSNAIASVPATVTIPEGATSTTFTITTVGVTGFASAAITATNGVSTRTADLSVSPTRIAFVSLSPSAVPGGSPCTGTITLGGLAPAGGALVTLSSANPSAATVPASITIPAGAPSATFPVTTLPVVGMTNLRITGSFGGISQDSTLAVTPLPSTLTSVYVAPTLVNGGVTLTGRVSLSTSAGGLAVSLSSSDPAVASAPSSVTVPGGASFADFPISTTGVAAPAVVTFTATSGSVTRNATLTVNPAALSSVSLTPFSLVGGASSIGTVSMLGKAHAAGVVIALSSSDSNVATVPASITVPSGASSARFTTATNPALTTGSATISATGAYGGNTATALLSIAPAPISLVGFSLNTSTVVAGAFVDATVTLSGPAPAGQTTIVLSSTNPAIAPISSLNLSAGTASGTVRIYTGAVSASSTVTLSAKYNGLAISAPLTVTPALAASITFTPSAVGGGYGSTGTLAFSGMVAAGTVVSLTSSNPAVATVPTTVSTATLALTVSFAITTTTVAAPTPVTITATLGSSTASGVLSVDPVGLANVTAGGVVALNAPAPAGGFSVAMTISGAARFQIRDQYGIDHFPTSTTLLIPAGQTQGSVGVILQWSGTGGQPYTVTAILNGVTRTASGTVSAGTASFTIDLASVGQGGTTYGSITFDAFPNYAANFRTDLVSSNPGVVLTDAHPLVCPGSQCDGTIAIHLGTPWVFPIGITATSGTGATTISATFLGFTATAPLNVAPAATLSGVAPGWVLAGDTTPVIYGSGIGPGSSVTFTGPVYSLTDFQNPLCNVGGTCPTSTLAATLDVGGTFAAFAIPPGAAPGIYHLAVRSAAGFDSSNNLWVGVDNAQKTYSPVARDQHNWAKRIWPGQTVTGTLTGDVPLNDLADYNYYFFVATAGSRVSVAMQRVDTSIAFGNPASLDPQIEIISPDHFIYENLQGFDDVPSVDYNASITNAVLPHTGVYFIVVETTRGSGDYRLTFNVDSMAPPPQTSRAVAFSGNHNTFKVNTEFTTHALMLDPRGWPLSGAGVNHTVVPSPDNLGTVEFVGGSTTTTSVDGYAFVNARLTSPGKVGFSPVLVDATLAQGVVLQEEETAAALRVGGESQRQAAQRYRPAGRLPIRIVGISGNEVSLSAGRLERFPAPEPAGRMSIAGEELKSSRRATLRTKAQSASTSNGAAGPAPLAARSPARPLTIRPQVITGCFPTVFDEAAVSASQINPPFTVVLTDETPSTGQSMPNGVVDEIDGIHGHRTEKEIRLKIDIKDAYGQTPTYPVLVSLAPGGSAPGTIILDPSGARIECESAALLWHETPGANEEIGYKLGTYSSFLGVEVTTLPYKPVWGIGELLYLAISALDASGLSQPNEYLYPVRVEPGKPDHFFCVDASGVPCPNLLAYWSDYLKFRSGTKMNGDPRYESLGTTLFNSYFLHDRYDNVTYGYKSTLASQPQPNIFVEFKDQTLSIFGASLDTTDFAAYSTWVHWNDDPSMPAGRFTTTLSVNYPNDPDWAGGTVTKNLDLQFDRGTYHALVPVPSYEARLGVDDGGTPFSVAPGATTAAMPKTSAGDVRRLVLLGMTGSQVIGTWPLQVEPFEDPHTIWKQSGSGWVVDRLESPQDLRLETSDAPRFQLSLRDEEGKVVREGAFRVHRCPRFDHEGPPQQSGPTGQAGRPCDALAVPPLDSVDGIVDPVTLNPSGGSNNHRGYLGIELLKAPARLGYYFLQVDPSSGDTPRYRIRLVNNQGDHPEAEYHGGEAFFLVENKIDPNAMCCTCVDGKTLESPCTASPVFAATGTYQSEATDLVLPTAGLPLQVSRQYFSSKRQSDLNGIGWSSSLQAHLSYAPTSAGQVLDVQMPTGVVFRFTFSNPNGPFTPPQGRKDTLVKNVDKTFDLTLERSRIVYHFDDKGRLVSMKDEYGNTVTIGYDASGKPTQVADASGSGRVITVSYRGDGKIDHLQDSAGRIVQYAYAADGTLTSVTDPAGRATRYGYTQGSFGPLLTQIADHWNRPLTVMTYDVADRTKTYTESFETYSYTYIDTTHTRKTDSLGNSTTVAFGGSGLIADSTPPATGGSGTTHKDYDVDGNITRTIDEVGVRTDVTYDPAGRVTSVTRDVLGSPVRFDYTYDPAFPDKVTSVTPKNPASGAFDPNWQGWRYDYLASGALNHVKRVQSDGSTMNTISTFQYDAQGRVTQQTSSTGAGTDYLYTGADLTSVTQPSNADSGVRPVTQYSNYDGVGRPRTITDPAAKDTTYTYDALGRVFTVTLPKPTPSFPGTFATTYSYDNFDSLTGLVFTNITDPNGKLTKLGYDQHGRLLKSIDALNNVTTYAYTNDVLASITDANGNVTSYHYDPLKRLDKTTFPDGSIESYAYGGDGLLASKTDRRGQTISYTYDGFKRLKQKDYGSNGTIAYTYVGQKLTQVDDTTVTPNETHTFGYDASYRVQQNVQGPRGTLSYTYTPDDRVDTMTIAGTPNVTTAHTYYADGSLNTMSWSPQAGLFKYAYTPRGQYQTVTFPNGQTRSYAYDDQGRLTQLANALGATNIATYAYGYDTDWATGLNTILGQRVSMTASVPSQGFTNALTKYSYDPLYQLKKTEYPSVAPFNGEVYQWTYDAIGNRLTNQVNAAIQSYTYLKNGANPLNGQELQNDGTNAYTYDLNGNQTARSGPGGNFVFSSDFDNRLRSITGATGAAYTYDYQGRRTSKTIGGVTTTYLYDGLNLISETTAGATTRYAFGPSIDEPLAMYRAGTLSYIDVDGLGTTVLENDTSGAPRHSSIFDVWGVTRGETGTRFSAFGYTGREFGEAGLWFYRARYYQPAIGRFGAEDPLGWFGDPTFYAYVSSSPLSLRDPLGLFGLEETPDWAIDALQTAGNAANGFADNLTFGGVNSILSLNGANSAVNRCSGSYTIGQWAGTLWWTALGGALGAEAAGTKGAGQQFSHWIPDRILKKVAREVPRDVGRFVKTTFGRSFGNGNYVSLERHYLHDPYAYSIGWQAWGAKWPAVLQQIDRIPRLLYGAGAGAGVGMASQTAQSRCECR